MFANFISERDILQKKILTLACKGNIGVKFELPCAFCCRIKSLKMPQNIAIDRSTGIHVEMNVGDKCMIDHYQRMGFFPIVDIPGAPDDVVYLGRAI